MTSLMRKGQRGFTLVELMVVVAILAVLAAIVMPAVSGTKEVSTDAQVKTDAGMVQTAAGQFFGDQSGAETVTTTVVPAAFVSAGGALTDTESVSNKWPETRITSAYAEVFAPATALTVTIKDDAATPLTITVVNFVKDYTAIDFDGVKGLATLNYIPEAPGSADTLAGTYSSYLWTFKKTTAEGGEADASRSVTVFKLTGVTVSSAGVKALFYEQIF